MQGNETQEVIQIIELSGRGAAFLLRGGIGTLKAGKKVSVMVGKGSAKAVKWGSAKKMQHRLKCHYASKGKHSDFSLKDMEKLTGGNYGLYKIPLEEGQNPEELKRFFKALKVRKIAFTEMPDLNIGDGYMEIAYNPVDAEKLRSFLEGYKFPDGKKAMETNFDDYIENATPEGEKNLTQDAISNIKMEDQKKNQIIQQEMKRYQKNNFQWKNTSEPGFNPFAGCLNGESLKERYKQLVKTYHPDLKNGDTESFQYVKDAYKKQLKRIEQQEMGLKEFQKDCKINDFRLNDGIKPITVNIKLVIKETEKTFITKIPYRNSYIEIHKNKSQIIDNGKTIKTFLDVNEEYPLFDKSGQFQKKISGRDLQHNYDPVKRDTNIYKEKLQKDKTLKNNTMKKAVKPVHLRKQVMK